MAGVATLLLAGAGALWTAQVARERAIAAELERARAAAEAEQARVAQELRERLKRQTEAERFVAEGVQLAGSGKLSEAIERYNQAIQLNPESAVAHQFLGYTKLRRAQLKRSAEADDVQKAVESLETAVALNPNYDWAFYNLALAYWEIGRRQEAVAAVKRVLEIDPRFASVIAGDGQFARFRQSSEFRALLRSP